MPLFTEEQLIRRKIERRFNKALKDYNLLSDGDRILIALSGGKDSLAMLELLAARSRSHKPRITVVAAHVRLKNIEYLSEKSTLEKFCSDNNVEIHFIDGEFDASTDKGNHLVSSVHGTDERRFLPLQKSLVATSSL